MCEYISVIMHGNPELQPSVYLTVYRDLICGMTLVSTTGNNRPSMNFHLEVGLNNWLIIHESPLSVGN